MRVSEYVEARYASLVIQQARISSEWIARDLLIKLLRDLCPHVLPAGLEGNKRVEALHAIHSLALSFDHHLWPPEHYWDNAQSAAEAWRNESIL